MPFRFWGIPFCNEYLDVAHSAAWAYPFFFRGDCSVGRPSGSLNKTTSEQFQRLCELAKEYSHDALLTLVDVAKNGRSDAARVSAANALLDRGYGKPAVKEEIEHVDLPPVVIQIKAPDEALQIPHTADLYTPD